MLRNLYYKLPPRLRFIVRYLFFLPHDLLKSIFNNDGNIHPPRRLIFTGSGDFIKMGKLFQNELIANKIITPSSYVLDVGCGIGRNALPLTTYLSTGKYEGFDIIKLGINWCKNNISTKYPNFNFTLVNLSNDLYKKDGESAKYFKFPYEDNSFDLVLVISVFTHMLPEEVNQYLSEIHRVLKIKGHCYSTFFILNDASERNMELNNSEFNFPYNMGVYSLLNKEVKSANVAYQEDFLTDTLVVQNKFVIKSLEYGSWSMDKSENPIKFQDILIVQKP